MSALGQKQTLDRRPLVSAIHPKADIVERDRHVRFVPKADIVDLHVPRRQQDDRMHQADAKMRRVSENDRRRDENNLAY
jgi:hypothetical protein